MPVPAPVPPVSLGLSSAARSSTRRDGGGISFGGYYGSTAVAGAGASAGVPMWVLGVGAVAAVLILRRK